MHYKTLDDLPLSKFIDCIVDGNLSALTISDYPTKEELEEAWQHIVTDYVERIASQEYRMYTSLFKELSIQRITWDQIRIAIDILSVIYDEFFAKEVNKHLRTKFKFDWTDSKKYHEEISRCRNRSKSIKIKLDLLELRFKALEEKNKNVEEVKWTRHYFTSILITLSDHCKYRLDESIKMSEYCERIKRFNQYIESNAKRTNQ